MCNCSKGEEKLAIPGDRVDESGTYVISRVIYCIDYSSGDGTVEIFYFLIIKGSSLNLNNSMYLFVSFMIAIFDVKNLIKKITNIIW